MLKFKCYVFKSNICQRNFNEKVEINHYFKRGTSTLASNSKNDFKEHDCTKPDEAIWHCTHSKKHTMHFKTKT